MSSYWTNTMLVREEDVDVVVEALIIRGEIILEDFSK